MNSETRSETPAATRFFLPASYRQRSRARYFHDATDDGIVWQPDVYRYAEGHAVRLGCDTVIDLGCGRAGKLAALWARHRDWHIIGVDLGPNIEWCAAHRDFGEWIGADLETATWIEIAPARLNKSIVICSDVLEHLVRPDVVVALIKRLLEAGGGHAVLSTPAREKRAGRDHAGPPANPAHVREWASGEFLTFLVACGLHIVEFAYTRSDDGGGGFTTQLVLVSAAADREKEA